MSLLKLSLIPIASALARNHLVSDKDFKNLWQLGANNRQKLHYSFSYNQL